MLPTHRVVRGLGDDGVAPLRDGLPELFDGDARRPRTTLVARFEARRRAGRRRGPVRALDARRRVAAEARRERVRGAPSPTGGDAVRGAGRRRLLGAALERSSGSTPPRSRAGERIALHEVRGGGRSLVERATDGADAAFLLEPTPVASILAVAGDGDVMPQKSTYFYPKALTGLVLNPHEW